MYQVGVQPGVQFSGDDLLKGKCPAPGTFAQTSDGKIYFLGLVAASQNLVNGHLVTYDPRTFTVTIAAAGQPAPSAGTPLAIARTSVTASASAYIWCQVFGVCSVLATTSSLPNVTLVPAQTAGNVTHTPVTTASGVIQGLVLTATSGTAGTIAPAFANFPTFTTPGQPG